jgi:hypothetical protein
MRVELEANVGRAGVRGGVKGTLVHWRHNHMGGNETSKGTELAAGCS